MWPRIKKIMAQFRQLGASVDWDNYTFTLDPKVVKQAHATFKNCGKIS